MSQNGIDNRIELFPNVFSYEDPSGDAITNTGWGQINELARRLCLLVAASTPFILKFFGDNQKIVALLELVGIVCGVLITVSGNAAQGTLESVSDETLPNLAEQLQDWIDLYGSAV